MKRKDYYLRNHRERGAIIIIVYLSLLAFLTFSVLVLDIPYLERTGRSLQRAVDAAALAGTTQLSRKNLLGWRSAKRAALLALQENGIAGTDWPTIDLGTLSGTYGSEEDEMWEPAAGGYQYIEYTAGGTRKLKIRFDRGIYQPPETWTVNTKIFWSLEEGQPARDANDKCRQVDADGPTACASLPWFYEVADAMRVTVTLENIPTLMGKVLGLTSFSYIERTGTASPEVAS